MFIQMLINSIHEQVHVRQNVWQSTPQRDMHMVDDFGVSNKLRT